MDIQTANADTNTNTFNQIGIINSDKTKQKPHNITIKNFNPNEPKIRKSNLLYTDKQKYRKYKTNIEPKLYSTIMVDDEEDLIAKIRKNSVLKIKPERIIAVQKHQEHLTMKSQNSRILWMISLI